MNKAFQTLEFDRILSKLEEYCYTEQAKEKSHKLTPFLSEKEVHLGLRQTSEARRILDNIGTPPLVSMKDVERHVLFAKQGGMLIPEYLELIGNVLTATKRLKEFLNKCKKLEVSLAYYEENLQSMEDLREEIQRSIRGALVDDYASTSLRDIRKNIANLQEKIKSKAEGMLRINKECYSDSFIVNRSGHICLPVKKEYKFRINGSVIDKSSTGSTLFIEPTLILNMTDQLQVLLLEEDNEVSKILYTLSALIAEEAEVFEENMKNIVKLDFIFAKGKLSAQMGGMEPDINTNRYIAIQTGYHPLMEREKSIPLDFKIGNGVRGIVITGPNTGGKTVAIKTVGVLCLMAQSGLHIPCVKADICMNNQVLCDIGDGQNITENLSTFSSHITNILDILEKSNGETLVILDELGSGTDPTEGMGIAIAILEELKDRGCLFLVTTHYLEVKTFAEQEREILNARMSFDPETLRPFYKLELGKSGESCALYIAKRLGMPDKMLAKAYKEAYGNDKLQPDEFSKSGFLQKHPEKSLETNLELDSQKDTLSYNKMPGILPKIQKLEPVKLGPKKIDKFQIGDSVLVYPEKKIGIIYKRANDKGEYPVQLKNEKRLISHKRLKLQVAARELYPEDYDFSIVFDSVANRKEKHKMGKSYRPDLVIKSED